MKRTIILRGGIWKKGERQLIAEVKNHPELYEENGKLTYGIERYETSWEKVAKQVGESVFNCKRQWNKIQFDYENHMNKSGKNYKTKFSKYLDGTLDFLKRDKEIIQLPKPVIDLNPKIDLMCIDSESSDISDQEKSENDLEHENNVEMDEVNVEKGGDLVLVDAHKLYVSKNTENEKMFSVMKLAHKDSQSRLKSCESVQIPNNLLNLPRDINQRQRKIVSKKPSLQDDEEISFNICSDDVKLTSDNINMQPLVAIQDEESGSLKSITCESEQVQRKNSSDDEQGSSDSTNSLKSITTDYVKVRRKRKNVKKNEAGPSKNHAIEYPKNTEVNNISSQQYMFGKFTLNKPKRAKTKTIDDSTKNNGKSNSLLKKLLNNKFKEPINRGSELCDSINKLSSNNDKIVNIMQGNTPNVVNENPTIAGTISLDFSKSNESLVKSPNVESLPKENALPVVYITTHLEGQAVCVTPFIIKNYCANSTNISSETTLNTHIPTIEQIPKVASHSVQPTLIENIPDFESHCDIESEDIVIKEENLDRNVHPESSNNNTVLNENKSCNIAYSDKVIEEKPESFFEDNNEGTESHIFSNECNNIISSNNIIKEKLDSILDVNAEETNMNIFFDQLAEYVTNTYALEKQLDIRSKICALVQTAAQKINENESENA